MKSFYHATNILFSLVLAFIGQSYGQETEDTKGEVVIVATTPSDTTSTRATTGEVIIVATTPDEAPTETTTGEVIIVATTPDDLATETTPDEDVIGATTPDDNLTETTTGEVIIVATTPDAVTDIPDGPSPTKEGILSDVLIVATVQLQDSAIHSTSWRSIKRSLKVEDRK